MFFLFFFVGSFPTAGTGVRGLRFWVFGLRV